MVAKDISKHIVSRFVPLVGVTEMKFFLLDVTGTPINNPNCLPNKIIPCPDGWRYRIETEGMDCREILVGNISSVVKSNVTYDDKGYKSCKVAIHPPKQAEGMPKRFILYPTKAVPYLRMNNSEPKAEVFHKNPEVMAKWTDVFVGLISVLLDRNEATKRAFDKGYLEPGLFESVSERGMGYVFEYHSLSSYWSMCPELISLIMANMRVAARVSWAELECKPDSSKVLGLFWNKVSYDEVRDAIKGQDFDHALDIYNRIKEYMVCSSTRTTDPLNAAGNKNGILYLEYAIMKGVSNIWSSTNLVINFSGNNGWFTGMSRRSPAIKTYFSSRDVKIPTSTSELKLKNIGCKVRDKEPVARKPVPKTITSAPMPQKAKTNES